NLYTVTDVFFFFFSSRRRHTRFSRDWSSDVCSSDLGPPGADHPPPAPRGDPGSRAGGPGHRLRGRLGPVRSGVPGDQRAGSGPRSEERRVGKECRSRRWREHEKNTEELETRAKL